jgi:hypothetical protein
MKLAKYVLNSLAQKHILSITSAIIAMILICRYSINAFEPNDFILDIMVNVLSGWAAAAAVMILYYLERAIKNRCEDSEKLTDDYGKLTQIYAKDNLITCESDHGLLTFPVVLLGSVAGIPITADSIYILDEPNNMYQPPDMLENHFTEIFASHGTSTVYNALNVRVVDMHLDETGYRIRTGRTTYFHSLITNRAMDWEWAGTTTRNLYEYGPTLSKLADSKLSNHLGFNGFVESSDHKILFVKRNGNVSIGKFTYGDSIGASLKAKYALDSGGHFSVAGLRHAILAEIYDELKISEDYIHTDEIKIIAAYRDCVEGGKPQFLFYATTFLTHGQIENNFHANHTTSDLRHLLTYVKHGDFQQLKQEYGKLKMLTDGTTLAWIEHDDIVERRVEIYPDGITATVTQNHHCSKRHMKMVPSASACVALLQQYLTQTPQYSLSVIESAVVGKQNGELCEDGLVISEHFVAVIDGVTTDGAYSWDGSSPGKVAKELIVDTLQHTDCSNMDASSLFSTLDMKIAEKIKATEAAGTHLGFESYPRASIILYNATVHQVWSYGDCRCKIDGILHEHLKQVDKINTEMRCMIDEAALLSGTPEADIVADDLGRTSIQTGLTYQLAFENKDHPLGYPTLNGCGINPNMIRTYPVKPGATVILASDGYPQVCDTLADSEDYLRQVLNDDPLCIKNNPSTKCKKAGTVSYDDRTYCRLKA